MNLGEPKPISLHCHTSHGWWLHVLFQSEMMVPIGKHILQNHHSVHHFTGLLVIKHGLLESPPFSFMFFPCTGAHVFFDLPAMFHYRLVFRSTLSVPADGAGSPTRLYRTHWCRSERHPCGVPTTAYRQLWKQWVQFRLLLVCQLCLGFTQGCSLT
jgi:hypothetical protein